MTNVFHNGAFQLPEEADVQRPGWVRLDGVLPLGKPVAEAEARQRVCRLLGIEGWDNALWMGALGALVGTGVLKPGRRAGVGKVYTLARKWGPGVDAKNADASNAPTDAALERAMAQARAADNARVRAIVDERLRTHALI